MSNCLKTAIGKRVFSLCNDCKMEGKPNIEFLSLSTRKEFYKKSENTSLFFLMESEAEVSYRTETRLIEKGCFFLIPANENYSIRSTSAKLMVCSLEEKFLVRHRRKAGLLYEIYNTKLPDIDGCELLAIKTNRFIQSLLYDCLGVENNALMCSKYTYCKTEELIILLRSYYPNELLARLFHPAFNGKVDFEHVIMTNCNKLFTVDEYAAATRLDRNTFRYRFKEIYGMTPASWIKRERADIVFRELTEGKKPIATIIKEYKFSNFPNFIRFCNEHFNNTPGNIRKNIEMERTVHNSRNDRSL